MSKMDSSTGNGLKLLFNNIYNLPDPQHFTQQLKQAIHPRGLTYLSAERTVHMNASSAEELTSHAGVLILLATRLVYHTL